MCVWEGGGLGSVRQPGEECRVAEALLTSLGGRCSVLHKWHCMKEALLLLLVPCRQAGAACSNERKRKTLPNDS